MKKGESGKKKEELAKLFESAASRTLESITDKDIEKSTLQSKLIAAGIATEKSLLLKGQLPTLNFDVLIAVLIEIRKMDQDPNAFKEKGRGKLPAGDTRERGPGGV